MSVAKRFNQFHSNISLTEAQREAGRQSRRSIVTVLNKKYYSSGSSEGNSKFIGSWGKFTRVRPPRDVDILYELPYSTYTRFIGRTGNIQSQILQEVRSALLASYPSTSIKGSGPIVSVPFSGYKAEMVPAFKLNNNKYWICETTNGGRFKEIDYDTEFEIIKTSDSQSSGATRKLVKFSKRWQAYCSVQLKSFWIELLAVQFMRGWEHRAKGAMYYDWMCRDFLHFLCSKANSYLYSPGTYDMHYISNAWLTKAKAAASAADTACSHEGSNEILAGLYWQDIFGTDIPSKV
ncbi:SMODS domain-containing nucleotidyltransferase [Palleronia pelagia]|uniref:Nucleotidyltransferase n=1 Tax=Palleronia pelagia TaxID=387096 RepID=A0A1H8B9E2_9RHOB|nr:nucleotidyltransferase [Palleronia pelagia]SEM79540.1 hypothetical protein SAMN04488011_101501 [Palleronia pelagia]